MYKEFNDYYEDEMYECKCCKVVWSYLIVNKEIPVCPTCLWKCKIILEN